MQFLSSHGAAEDVCRGWLLTMAAEAAEDGCSSKGSSSFKCSLFLRGIGLAGQDGALPSSFVLLGCPNHGKIFSSRRATPSSLCARPTFVDTCFQSTSRRPYCILPDSNIRIKIQNLLGLDANKIQAVATPTIQGVFQQTSRTKAQALLSCFTTMIQRLSRSKA